MPTISVHEIVTNFNQAYRIWDVNSLSFFLSFFFFLILTLYFFKVFLLEVSFVPAPHSVADLAIVPLHMQCLVRLFKERYDP